MGPLILAAIVFAVVFVGGAIGLELQRALPASFTTGGPKDMTGAVVGLMTLLLALVLGLLIWTAYGVYSTQKVAVQTLAISVLKFDEALQAYGPEAAEGRRILREGIKNTIAEIWGGDDDEDAVIHKFGYAMAYQKERLTYLDTLQAESEQQKAAKSEATQAAIAIGQTRTQMTVALSIPSRIRSSPSSRPGRRSSSAATAFYRNVIRCPMSYSRSAPLASHRRSTLSCRFD